MTEDANASGFVLPIEKIDLSKAPVCLSGVSMVASGNPKKLDDFFSEVLSDTKTKELTRLDELGVVYALTLPAGVTVKVDGPGIDGLEIVHAGGRIFVSTRPISVLTGHTPFGDQYPYVGVPCRVFEATPLKNEEMAVLHSDPAVSEAMHSTA
jgi:hypothetical protein